MKKLVLKGVKWGLMGFLVYEGLSYLLGDSHFNTAINLIIIRVIASVIIWIGIGILGFYINEKFLAKKSHNFN